MQWKKVEEFLPYIMPEVNPCPPDMVQTYLQFALHEFCTETWAWNQWTDKEAVDNGSTEIYLTYPSQSRPDGIMKAKKNDTEFSLHKLSLEDDVVVLDEPLNRDSKFQFKIALKPIRKATVVPEWIFENYVETIAAGTKYKLMTMAGQPWANPELGTYNYQQFRKGISQAGSRKRTKQNTGRTMTVQPKTFGYWR